MKIKLLDRFLRKLNRQVAYIAADKPTAARKFKKDILAQIRTISRNPYQFRRSIYFEDKSIREMIFKGYTIVFKVDEDQNEIIVFGFVKWQEGV